MPRSKKAGRSVKQTQRITITEDTTWLLRNFLTRMEKMALVGFYRDKIDAILEKDEGEYAKNSGDDHDVRRFGKRIKFIMDHF